ncbi:alcohol dehydrogenase [Hymenopellis radicata]|nr:alcohol dehydrogenase [Hymenopellis radicata]
MQTAIRFHPPSYDIRVEQVPVPKICHPDDAIVKVHALIDPHTGSDLHIYRGHGGVDQVHTSGHEFIGEVVELGASFRKDVVGRPSLYATLKVGDKVVSPFSINCGECQLCRLGFSSRCLESKLFGSPALEGAQAQYVRVPRAGGTLFNLSDPSLQDKYANLSSISDSSLLFLGDILPTGLFAALQALHHPKVLPAVLGTPWPNHFVGASPSTLLPDDRVLTIAIVGLGPVGICALVALLDQLAKKQLRYRIIGVDLLESRREKMMSIYKMVSEAEGYGTMGTFVAQNVDEAKLTVHEWTSGWGVTPFSRWTKLFFIQIVGHNSALSLAYDLVCPFGVITSVGVHGAWPFPLTGRNLYDKNVSLDFGRCPAGSMLPMAFDLLVKRQDVFGSVGGETSLVDRVAGFTEASGLYSAFDKGEVGKILFDPWKQ